MSITTTKKKPSASTTDKDSYKKENGKDWIIPYKPSKKAAEKLLKEKKPGVNFSELIDQEILKK